MPSSNAYQEIVSSQLPALHLLTGMGWQYLTPAEALAKRGDKRSAVILDDVLIPWLRQHNHIERRGQVIAFSEANIADAVRKLKDLHLSQGLLPASSQVYDLLCQGASFEQTIDSDKRSYSMHYIDWQKPANNVYHVTDEFTVERRSSYETRRPDLVLFVNGIPLCVIECKRPDLDADGEPVEQAVSQMIRNQRSDEIPHLFVYTQLLLAAEPHKVLYGTTGTSKDFWAVWKDETPADALNAAIHPLINRVLTAEEKTRLYDHHEQAWRIRRHFDELGERLPTEQDRVLYSLLTPVRLLEMAYQFIVYDDGIKKIARYQQYFAIKATMDRVTAVHADNTRAGGVIWHTTGSGKSLTMVMLAKALALHPAIQNPRVVLVTDRVDLDTQIGNTFRACGKSAVKATSGSHLIQLVRDSKIDIITTIIDKFEQASRQKVRDTDNNVFVLVDESHRSQYGMSHAQMREVFQNGCYIGFTGTPLLKKEKTTAEKFGGFIHKYTMRQAVEDKAVVRLLYEGRDVDLDISRDQLDDWFERRTRTLTPDQKADLKRKMSRYEEVHRVNPRLALIAYNLAEHYITNHRGTGFKGQLATSSKEIAIQYYKLLKDEEGIDCAVIISAPDTREGSDSIDEEEIPAVEQFWRQMMQRYGNEENYNKAIKSSFGAPDGIEILIVVDKLLVGFDEPRNTVLYIDKSLREHGLLQAIARVNRLCEGKDYGYIVDYRGVLGELNEAMQTYNTLEAYDAEDIAGTVTDISQIISDLPQLHSQLWDVFKEVANKNDTEALERFLEPEDRRHEFYEALSNYARALKVALSAQEFFRNTPDQTISKYKRDLTFFHNLRSSVKQRYAETINYGDYEDKIRKLMNDHIKATGVSVLIKDLDIFDEEQFDQAVAQLVNPVAKADTIANHAKRTITEKMEEDPAFYRRLSQLIDETLTQYREGRLSEIEYLQQITAHEEKLRAGHDDSLPAKLKHAKDAAAYFGVIHDVLKDHAPGDDGVAFSNSLADLAIQCEQRINALKIRDWIDNPDVENDMRSALDSMLYDTVRSLQLPGSQLDLIIENILEVARKRALQP